MSTWLVALLVAFFLGAPVAAAPDPAPSATVPEDASDLVLWVSNQSFDDDPVGITVMIDGRRVIDQNFDVGSQHNWINFPLALGPGRHTMTATSTTGVTVEHVFRIGDQRRYAVLDYWFYPGDRQGGRHFSWRVSDEPVAFM